MLAVCCALMASLLNVLMELMMTPLGSLSCQDAISGLLLSGSAVAASCRALHPESHSVLFCINEGNEAAQAGRPHFGHLMLIQVTMRIIDIGPGQEEQYGVVSWGPLDSMCWPASGNEQPVAVVLGKELRSTPRQTASSTIACLCLRVYSARLPCSAAACPATMQPNLFCAQQTVPQNSACALVV